MDSAWLSSSKTPDDHDPYDDWANAFSNTSAPPKSVEDAHGDISSASNSLLSGPAVQSATGQLSSSLAANMPASSNLNHVFGHIPHEHRHPGNSTNPQETAPSSTEEPLVRAEIPIFEEDAPSTLHNPPSAGTFSGSQDSAVETEAETTIPSVESAPQFDELAAIQTSSINNSDSHQDRVEGISPPSVIHAETEPQILEEEPEVEELVGDDKAESQKHMDYYLEPVTLSQAISQEPQHGELDWMTTAEDEMSYAEDTHTQFRVELEDIEDAENQYNDEDTTVERPVLDTDAQYEEDSIPNDEPITVDAGTEDSYLQDEALGESTPTIENLEGQRGGITSANETSEDDWEKHLRVNDDTNITNGVIGDSRDTIQNTPDVHNTGHSADGSADEDWLRPENHETISSSAVHKVTEPDMSWMASEGLDTPSSTAKEVPVATQPQTLEADDNDRLGIAKPAVEDSWAQAFGDPAALDDTWGAAFADDEEGFLPDEPLPTTVPVAAAETTKSRPTSLYAPANAINPTPAAPTSNAFTPVPSPFANTYATPAAVQPPSAAQRNVSTPMQFFEDLPMNRPPPVRRPKQQILSPSPPAIPPPPSGAAPPLISGRPVAPPRTSSAVQSQYTQFRGPDKLDPFPPQPSVIAPVAALDGQYAVVAPPANNRYSPAMNQASNPIAPNKPPTPATSRYDSAQLTQAPQPFPQRAHSPYAPNSAMVASQPQPPPKTSTPVMFEELPIVRSPQKPRNAASQYAQTSTAPAQPSTLQGQAALASRPAPPPAANRFVPRTSSPLAYAGAPARALEPQSQPLPQQGMMQPPPALNPRYGAASLSKPKLGDRSVSYAPHLFPQQSPLQEAFVPTPPIRPRTSSPVHMRAQPQLRNLTHDRSSVSQIAIAEVSVAPPFVEHDIQDFVLPQDETAADQLQRWRGAPIFRWGSGGLVVSSIPKHIPRYGGGQSAPKLKPTSGEVKLQKAKDILSEDNGLGTFPGPLRSKGKKKDVLSWLSARIAVLEQMTATNAGGIRQAEEKVLLWRLMRLFVEHDGLLTGNASVTAAVKELLTIDAASAETVTAPLTSEISKTADPSVMNDIRGHLIAGDREKAVWHAVDNQLWGHALVLASTADNSLWKQVVQEFVKKQVRNTSQDSRSLAALYEVFAGNWDESIDQLVPLAARQGFQMVNTADQSGQARDAAEGLEKWRETLTLIVNNRSNGDENALLALGKLLISYGRVEAAHVCYLFARNVAVFGGADDLQAHFTLLGTDLASEASPKIADTDSILLTEVYEFALSLAPSAPTFFPPHLQSYKLQHAYQLAEIGLRSEGQQYCEAIGNALKSSTRGSPYYHPTLVAAVDDLSKRLSQSPQNSSSGWISKLSADKVSGSVWSKFNKFVVGDDADGTQAAAAAQAEEAGPFGRIGTGTPTISRSPSVADFLPGNDMVRVPSFGAGGGRYAPSAYGSSPEQNKSLHNPYAPSYGLSPDMAQKAFDRRLSQDTLPPAFGSPPRHPPFQRQSSTLSRYATNESMSAYEPTSMHPMVTQDSYVPLVAESVPENAAVDHSSYPASRRTSMQPPNTYTPSGPVTPSMEYPGFVRPPNNRYSTSSAVSDSRPSSSKYAPSAPDSESATAYAPLAPIEPSTGYTPATTYKATNPPDEAEAFERSADVEGAESKPEEANATSNGYEPSSYVYQPYEPSAPLSAPEDEAESGLTIDTVMKNEYQPDTSGYNPMGGYQPTNSYEPSTSTYDPSAGGYMPYQPDTENADPPSQVEEADTEDAPRPRKKGIMDLDDDDDFLQKQADDLKRQQKAQRDREADEVVRKAAEADGKSHMHPHTKSILSPIPQSPRYIPFVYSH